MTPCQAAVTIAHPRDHQHELLTVHSTRSARGSASIHYKTTTVVHSTVAGRTTGIGTIRFTISRPYYGYRVVVHVTTSSHESSAAAFTLER